MMKPIAVMKPRAIIRPIAGPVPTRRAVFAAATLAALHLAAPYPAAAAVDAGMFISNLLRDLAGVVNGSGQPRDKHVALAKIVDDTVDATGVARFCLGRFWRVATPAQQRDYLEVFHGILVNSVSGRIGQYQGVSFTIGQTAPHDGDFLVTSMLTRPNNAANKVDWLVSVASGSPKIIDLIAEGVSLRLTERSDYVSFLTRNGDNVQALIEALRQRLNSLQG